MIGKHARNRFVRKANSNYTNEKHFRTQNESKKYHKSQNILVERVI